MTILVGVLARDGAVIGADRQVTDGSVGVPTAKIATVGRDVAVATSGSVAHAQKIRDLVARHREEWKSIPYRDAVPAIEQAIRNLILPDIDFATKARHAIDGAENTLYNSSLAGIPFADGMRLCSIDWNGSMYCLTEDLPYIAIGSGKGNADPFLRFIWDVLWPERGQLPELLEAVFAAYWTIHLNIDQRSEGVGYGIDICTVTPAGNGNWRVHELEEQDLDIHDELIVTFKDAMRACRDEIFGSDGARPSAPPSLVRRD